MTFRLGLRMFQVAYTLFGIAEVPPALQNYESHFGFYLHFLSSFYFLGLPSLSGQPSSLAAGNPHFLPLILNCAILSVCQLAHVHCYLTLLLIFPFFSFAAFTPPPVLLLAT